jgi:polyribonucleotide nucleotidyltransferase
LESQSFMCEVGGKSLVIETGKLAGQANSAVTVRYGDTEVLVTACVSSESREGTDFVPLTIDYEERLYAAGKIPGGFIRREGRPSQEAILASRLTDRPLRPLLPKGWRNEIQVIITVLSADQENNPDIMAVIGGSAALTISEVPFEGPVAAVRVGYINNELVLNPTLPQLENSQLELVVVSSSKAIVMTEGEAKEVPEDIIMRAIKFGHEANQEIIRLQERLQQAVGKPKMEAPAGGVNPGVAAMIAPLVEDKIAQALSHREKPLRQQELDALKQEVTASLGESFSEEDIIVAFESKVREELRNHILKRGERIDGRGLTEVRPITCEVGLLPRTHGSGLFTRGQTQVLTITTLGSVGMEQKLDGLGIEETKRFMHHYNMPPFSGGEVKRIGTPGRREIGRAHV